MGLSSKTEGRNSITGKTMKCLKRKNADGQWAYKSGRENKSVT